MDEQNTGIYAVKIRLRINKQELLRELGQAYYDAVMQRFASNGTDPFNAQGVWLLRKKDVEVAFSNTKFASKIFWYVEGDTLHVVHPRHYANFHHYGTKNMTSRRFFPTKQEIAGIFKQIILKHLKRGA